MGTRNDDASQEISLTYTGILKKGDKKLMRVRFSRNGEKDYAEGVIPGCTIERAAGFSEKELASLRFYMQTHEKQLREKAKEISGLRGFFR